jgi:3-hydroxyisobutyrate dehydrogenase
MKSVGFIGLGVLGSAVAPHLARAGHRVFGFDIEPERLRDLQADGIVATGSAQDAAERSEVVITCLPSAEALHEAVSGEDGIANAAGTGRIVIEISTLPVAEKERARAALASAGKVLSPCSGPSPGRSTTWATSAPGRRSSSAATSSTWCTTRSPPRSWCWP